MEIYKKKELSKSIEQYEKELYNLIVMELLSSKDLLFFGIFLSELNKEFSLDVPTACVARFSDTSQIKLMINPLFWDTLSNKEKLFILSHEIMHVVEIAWDMQKAFNMENHKMFNIAADLSINTQLADVQSLNVPEGAMMPKLFPKLKMKSKETSIYYYELLKNNPDKLPFPMDDGEGGSGEGEGNEEGSGNGSLTLEDILSGKVDIHPGWKSLTEGMSDVEKEVFKRKIVNQVKEVAESVTRQHGKLPCDIEAKLPPITPIAPVTSWKTIFKQFIGYTTSMSKKYTKLKLNKRIPWTPGNKDIFKIRGFYGYDSSGSISDKDLHRIHQELNNIWKSKGAEIDYAAWDDGVGELNKYKGQVDLKRTKCGGTNCNTTLRWIRKNYKKHGWQFAIIATDGYFSDITEPEIIPTLYIIVKGGKKLEGRHKQIFFEEYD